MSNGYLLKNHHISFKDNLYLLFKQIFLQDTYCIQQLGGMVVGYTTYPPLKHIFQTFCSQLSVNETDKQWKIVPKADEIP